MASSFQQWESDPLFSAAEVVQDSADRMESIFRIFLHEQSLCQGDPTDPKILDSIDYHRRDVATALGTTKWQLEDFERAVNLTALSDSSRMREDAISRHKQFIRAIKEQIVHVEKGLEGSKGVPRRNSQWMNLNENDRDGLALFLTGGNSIDHLSQYDSGSSIMKRFFDSTNPSEFDNKSDEIIELKTEDIEDSQVNGAMRISHSLDNLKENKLRKAGSNYGSRLGFETSISMKELVGNDPNGNWDLENSDSNAKSVFSKNKLRGSRSRLDVLGFLGNLWSVYGTNMSKSFIKRTKDGEVRADLDQNPSAPYIVTSPAEKVRHTWMGLASASSSLCGLCNPDVFKENLQSCHYRRGYQRLRYIIHTNQFAVRAAATFLTLTVLGIMIFRVT